MSIFGPLCEIPPCIADLFDGAVVQLNPGIEGQRIHKGVMYLGTRSGPVYTVDALLHEMCHFTEIDEARMFSQGWGFYRGVWQNFATSYSPGYYEYFGVKDVEREERVLAWQANVAEHLDVEYDFESNTSSLQHLPGFSNMTTCLGAPRGKTGKINFIRERVMRLRKDPRFTATKFIEEWHRRNEILRNLTTLH